MEHFKTERDLTEKSAYEISPESFGIIREIMKDLRRFNLESYKDKYIKRRIAIRIRASHCATAEEYCRLLLQDENEVDLLLKVLTIHVSQFFRNPPTFAKLREEVLPNLFARIRDRAKAVQIWSVGCASGEEPYSLAMILKESFAAELARVRVDILATDVNEAILDMARRGVYGEERLIEVPAAVKQLWFKPDGGKYHLRPEIKAMVQFRHADLFCTDAFCESDLILCRNVLIYFEQPQQKKIINGFANALRSGGVLVLGKSETLVGESRQHFQTICPVERIYRAV